MKDFLCEDINSIFGEIISNDHFSADNLQKILGKVKLIY